MWTVRLRAGLSREIASWGLSEPLWMNVMLVLHQHLREFGVHLLRRVSWPFDGMVLEFRYPDPASPADFYYFAFHVSYGPDEETLHVLEGYRERFDAP